METIKQASNFAHEAVDKIASASHQAAESLDQTTEQLKTAEQRMVKNCQVYIRNNPLTTLGIAVAGGFLLSRLLSSR